MVNREGHSMLEVAVFNKHETIAEFLINKLKADPKGEYYYTIVLKKCLILLQWSMLKMCPISLKLTSHTNCFKSDVLLQAYKHNREDIVCFLIRDLKFNPKGEHCNKINSLMLNVCSGNWCS